MTIVNTSPRGRFAAVIGAAVLALGAALAASEPAQAKSPRHPHATLLSPNPKLVRPGVVHRGGESIREAAPIVAVAQKLYTWWDTGDSRYLFQAVAPKFRDRTLPAGRPQGRAGIIAASRQFRAAVPNLRCRLAELYVTGHTFTARLVFTGRFTGTLNGRQGTGQPIRFNAIDIQHVGPAGRITEDWHIEDNLTFLKEAGVVAVP